MKLACEEVIAIMCVSSLSPCFKPLISYILFTCLVTRSRLVEGVWEVKWMLYYSGVCDTGGV